MATHIAKMVSLAQSPEKVKETMPAIVADKSEGPTYPWGACLRFSNEEIAKLKLEGAQVGDTIHVFALGKVTSVSASARENNESQSIEIQLTDMAAENEDRENEEEDSEEKERASHKRWYGDGPRSED